MTKHAYWGNVSADWAGFSGEVMFSSAHVTEPVSVFLGYEFDDEGDEVSVIPTAEQLTEFESTYRQFLAHSDQIFSDIKTVTFDRYIELYAHYYEHTEKSGYEPLCIDSAEKHVKYLGRLIYIRVLEDRTIQIPMRYELDPEHGLEVRLQDNKIIKIGGIADT